MPAQAWVTLLVASLGALGVIITWQQKNRADRRSEWWRRTAWSFERTFSTDEVQAELGWKALTTLMRSTLATKDDSDMVQVIAEHRALSLTGQEDDDGNPENTDTGRTQTDRT